MTNHGHPHQDKDYVCDYLWDSDDTGPAEWIGNIWSWLPSFEEDDSYSEWPLGETSWYPEYAWNCVF